MGKVEKKAPNAGAAAAFIFRAAAVNEAPGKAMRDRW
jgi:hypothetical protein